jgi:hypothetical protein
LVAEVRDSYALYGEAKVPEVVPPNAAALFKRNSLRRMTLQGNPLSPSRTKERNRKKKNPAPFFWFLFVPSNIYRNEKKEKEN